MEQLPEEESLRLTALDFALKFQLGASAQETLALAKLVYDFLKSGIVPEKDQKDGKLQ